MISLKQNTMQWILAAALGLGLAGATGTKLFAPPHSADAAIPAALLNSDFVLPPNYTDIGFTPGEMIALFAKRGFTARWERQGTDRYVLRFAGTNRLTGVPLDAAFLLRAVTGPHEVVSQVIGFTGPAVVVESMAEGGVPADWAETTNLFEGLQTTFVQEPGSRLRALVEAHRAAAGTPERRPSSNSDRPVVLVPTEPR